MPTLAPQRSQEPLTRTQVRIGTEAAPLLSRTIFFLLGVLALFIVLQFFVPLRTAIKIGADEDWELSKAMLALKGYHFYTHVWNDQPLLHTSIITSVLRNFSPTVLGPRL